MKVCKNCNNIVDDSAKFCNKCGAAFEEVGGENQADNRGNVNNYQGHTKVNIDFSNFFAWFKKRLLNQNFEQADDNFKYSLITLGIIIVIYFFILIANSGLFTFGFFAFAVSTGLIALMNYLGNGDIKKFINGLANKTVICAPFLLLALLLGLIPYFNSHPDFPLLLLGLSFIQYNMALFDIMFNDNFGKRIKVYIAMIYFIILGVMITKFIENAISSALMGIF